MSVLPLKFERVLASVLVDRLKVVVLYSDSQDHEQPEEILQVSDQVEVRVPYRESSVGRQRCYQSMQISQFKPSTMNMKCDWEGTKVFTHHLQRPVGFMIIPATLTKVMMVTGPHMLMICTVVLKCTRATLAVNEWWCRRDRCKIPAWAQAGAEPAIHSGSRD